MNDFEKINNPEDEVTEKTQKIIEGIDDLGLIALPYVTESLFNKNAMAIYMQAPEGYRVLVEKAGPDYIPEEERFFQGLKVSVHPGGAANPSFRQIDYNFDEKHDGKFRKRVLQERASSMEDVVALHSYEDVAVAGMTTHANAQNTLDNLQLEEDMGVNNQPATLDELRELELLLQRSKLLDPHHDYRPVE